MVAFPRLNPVIARELTSRMRGWRAVATLTAYLAVVGGFSLLFLYVASQQVWMGSNSALLGRSLLGNIVTVELFLVCFITPAFTAGVIAGERERQTHDLLFTTLLGSRSIVVGKLVSALAYVFLLIVAALPIQGIVFLLGGVAPDELALTFVLLFVTAVGIGSLSLMFSSIARTTLPATVLSYVAVLAIVIGTAVAYYLAGSLTRSTPPEWIAYANPFSAVSSVLSSPGGSPMFLPFFSIMPTVVRVEVAAPPPPGGMVMKAMPQPPQLVPVWEYYIPLYLATTAVATMASMMFAKPTHPWLARLKRR